jgi:hypothetical protein|tara:strand:- start:199 stop:444 length:246 start_codon:yes stop_codon:yes gene_type:complete
MKRAIKAHLKEAGKTYYEHTKFAVVAGLDLILTGIISIIHGFVPTLFPFYAEKKIDEYHQKVLLLNIHRKKNAKQAKSKRK